MITNILVQIDRKKGGGVYVSKQLEFKSRNELDKNIEDINETKFIEIMNIKEW